MNSVKGPHAVVVGLELNGLGVVRSLGRAGIPTIALDTDLGRPTCATRFARKIRVEALAGPPLLDALMRLRATLTDAPVLFLTQEASVETIAGQRDEVAAQFRFSMPDHDLMKSLIDKLRFQALAETLGFPIPRAVRLSRASGPELMAALRFPCVLKPTTKIPGWARYFKKAYKVASVDEAAGLWQEMHSVVDEVILQEWIEGHDSDVYFCLQYRAPNSGPITSFVGRKLRQWPPLIGGTACCVPAPEVASELTDLTNRFFGAVGFVGLGSMEYKRDRRDGGFYMVEPTVGRTDYQEEVATLNGVNIPLASYLGECGALPHVAPVGAPTGWRDRISDEQARLATGTATADPPGLRWRDAHFRFNDPMPFVALQLARLTRRLGRLSRDANPARSC